MLPGALVRFRAWFHGGLRRVVSLSPHEDVPLTFCKGAPFFSSGVRLLPSEVIFGATPGANAFRLAVNHSVTGSAA